MVESLEFIQNLFFVLEEEEEGFSWGVIFTTYLFMKNKHLEPADTTRVLEGQSVCLCEFAV